MLFRGSTTAFLACLATLAFAGLTRTAEQVQFDTDAFSGQVIDAELSEYIASLLVARNVNGLSLAVVRPDGGVEVAGWGVRTEQNDPMTPDTLMAIGSCSKAFLASAMGILMDDFATGKNVTPLPHSLDEFNWDTKVASLLPDEWKLQDEWASEKASVRDILSHVSGVPRHDFSVRPNDTASYVASHLRYLRPVYELRQKFSYNNLMYITASHIIATYAGVPYTQFVTERIFKPLKMSESTYRGAEAENTGALSQGWTSSGRRMPFPSANETVELVAGAGGVAAPMTDLAKWLKVLLNEGVDPTTNATIIPKSAFDAMTTAQVIVNGQGSSRQESIVGYGMGWVRLARRGREVVYHNGGIISFLSQVYFLPNDGIGVAVSINTQEEGHDTSADVAWRVVERALGLESFPAENEDRSSSYIMSSDSDDTPDFKQYRMSLHIDKYAGVYTNAGYGTITLCSKLSSSAECKATLDDFTTVDNASAAPSSEAGPPKLDAETQLFASFRTLWTSHLRVTHATNDSFLINPTFLFPQGYGADKSPFALPIDDTMHALGDFVVEGDSVLGFGVFGLVPEDVQLRKGGRIQDDALIWFEKV